MTKGFDKKMAKEKKARTIVRNIMQCGASVMLLSSCATSIISSVTSVGYAAAQERTVGDAIDDVTILTRIKSLYFEAHVDKLLSAVDVQVIEGRVMLTGKGISPDVRVEAVRLAWQPRGVKEVINELVIDDSKVDAQKYARDLWMTAEVKSKFLLNKIIRSINYSVETVDGVIYLMGIAKNKDELDEAKYLAGKISGVKKVVSHVLLSEDPSRN